MMGFLLALTRYFALRSYRRLNRAKFNVINGMEKALPEQYFTREMGRANENHGGRP